MTVLGLVLVLSGLGVLAVVRPWRSEPDEPEPQVRPARAPQRRPSPRARGSRPQPRPRDLDDTVVLKRHRVEMIPRGRRVPAEPGRPEIPLPDWLGPVKGPR